MPDNGGLLMGDHYRRTLAIRGPGIGAASSAIPLMNGDIQSSDHQHATYSQAHQQHQQRVALQREQAAHQQAAVSLQSSTSVVPMLGDYVHVQQQYIAPIQPNIARMNPSPAITLTP
jgi:hypothetical protein